MEVRCGGHLIHDMFHTNIHHIRNISPKLINHCEIHEGEIGKIGTVLSWKYIDGNTHFLSQYNLVASIFYTYIYVCWYYRNHFLSKIFPKRKHFMEFCYKNYIPISITVCINKLKEFHNPLPLSPPHPPHNNNSYNKISEKNIFLNIL